MEITPKIKQQVELQVKQEAEPVFEDFHRRMKPLKDIVLNKVALPDGRVPTAEEVDAIDTYGERCYRDIFDALSRREKKLIQALRKMPEPAAGQDVSMPPPFFKKEGERYLNLGKGGPEQAALYALLPVIMLGSGILQGGDFLLKEGVDPMLNGIGAAGRTVGNGADYAWNWLKFW